MLMAVVGVPDAAEGRDHSTAKPERILHLLPRGLYPRPLAVLSRFPRIVALPQVRYGNKRILGKLNRRLLKIYIFQSVEKINIIAQRMN